MRILLKNIPFYHFLFSLLMLAVASALNLRAMEYSVDSGPLAGFAIAATCLVWASSVVKLAIPQYRFYVPTAAIALFCAYFLWAVFPTLLKDFSTLSETAFNCIMVLSPLLTLYVAYNTAMNTGDNRWYRACFLLMGTVFVFQYFNVYMEVNFLETFHLVCSYYTLYILPLLLLTRRRAVRIVALVVVCIVLFSSLKRTGILALAIGITVFVFVNQYVEDRFRLRPFLISVGLLLCLGGFFFYLDSRGDESVFERFENIDKDHGSGRLEVWEHTGSMITSQRVGKMLTGNGYYAVERDSRLAISAHNDFLESAYDYGLIGLALYIGAVASLGIYVLKMILRKSPYAPSIAMLLAIFLISSMISHVVIYYWGNVFMLSFGYMIGNFKRNAAR